MSPSGTSLVLVSLATGEDGEDRYRIVAPDGRTAVGDLWLWHEDGLTGVDALEVCEGFRGMGYGRAAIRGVFGMEPGTQSLIGESSHGGEGFWDALGCTWTKGERTPYKEFRLDRSAMGGWPDA